MANGQSPPTYQNLFGSTAYHTVDPSRSVLSPAAYFVDLMRLKDRHLQIDKTNKMSLESRRPDLSQIPLDGKHTDTLISKLDIVNGVLQGYLDRTQQNPRDLAQTHYPFNLPFNQPLAEIHEYISQQDTSLRDIRKELAHPYDNKISKAIALDILELAPEQWQLYTELKEDDDFIKEVFGLSDNDQTPGVLSSVPTFLKKTWLNHGQLHHLLVEDLNVEEEKSQVKNFFINTGFEEPLTIKDDQFSPQLTSTRLNRIHRFVRLSQVLSWTFADLDWALRTIGKIVNSQENSDPVIRDDVLPYLAWFQELHKENNLSINQCCALIGTLKDFGTKDGPSFIDQVFKQTKGSQSSALNERSNQVWEIDPPQTADPNQQKESQPLANALATALQISHDDLLTIAKKMLKPNAKTLTLNSDNLAILYRLSLLPKLTGMSIQDAFVAAEIGGIKTDDLIASPGPATASTFSALIELIAFTKWLKGSPFSVYQLQFILKGKSDDFTLQNQIFSTDTITKFLNHLRIAIEKTTLTEPLFSHVISASLQRKMTALLQNGTADQNQSETNKKISHLYAHVTEITQEIYNSLQPAYLASNFIVLTTEVDRENLETTIKTIIHKELTNTEVSEATQLTKTELDQLMNDIVSILERYYHLQQSIFIEHLASAYHVSSQMGAALKTWGDSNITIPRSQDSAGNVIPASLLSFLFDWAVKIPQSEPAKPGLSSLTPMFLQLQQVAKLFTGLALSPIEAHYFVKDRQPPKKVQLLKLQTIRTMDQFKRLVHTFRDTQNRLLGLDLAIVSSHTGSPSQTGAPSTAAKTGNEQLAHLAGWHPEHLSYLYQQLKLQDPISIADVTLLKAYFDIADQLTIDMKHLWQLAHASFSDTSAIKDNANALWIGLQAKHENQSDVLTNVQNRLNEGLRDKLVPLVMHQLGVTTPRDLYEYFLIDVEVSGVVQTSRIKEAISAVQLYTYRCLNHLEPVVPQKADLAALWRWMHSYREWQANHKVFLYPEDYIQPELRKNKTELFAKIESDLKQADLSDPDRVGGIFKEYMNGFAEVAKLKIVGSAARDTMIDGTPTKELCLVGITGQQPHRYYYRVATFIPAQSNPTQYKPTDWGQWQKINIQIQPVTYPGGMGAVTPVFAFGKWYIFWVEQKTTGRKTKADGTHTPKYTTMIQYSHLDFSKRWVTSQMLTSIDAASNKITKQEDSRVYPIYYNSIQTLYIFISQINQVQHRILTENSLSQKTIFYHQLSPIRFQATYPLSQSSADNGIDFSYYMYYMQIGENLDRSAGGRGAPPPPTPTSLSTWLKVSVSARPLRLFGSGTSSTVSVQAGKRLIVDNIESRSAIIRKDEWYHVAWSEGNIYLNGKKVEVYPFYAGTSNGIYLLQADNNWQPQTNSIPRDANDNSINCLYVDNHVFYAGTNHGLYTATREGEWHKQPEFDGLRVNCLGKYGSRHGYYLYAGTNKGIYIFVNSSWQFLVSPLSEPVNVLSLYAIYADDSWLYAGTESHGLYAIPKGPSTGSWYQQRGIPANDQVRCLYFYSNTLYAGTRSGLYALPRSSANSGTWQLQQGEHAPKDVYSLFYFNNRLYAGTGNGLYALQQNNNWELEEGILQGKTVTALSASRWGWLYAGTTSGLYYFNMTTWGQVQGETLSRLRIYNLLSTARLSPIGPYGFEFPVESPVSAQETLYFEQEPLSAEQIKELYDNSKDAITRGGDTFRAAKDALKGAFTSHSVLMQPNWEVIETRDDTYLTIPYQEGDSTSLLTCYRLTSTAINKLSTLLHQPAGIDALLSVAAQRTPENSFAELKPQQDLIHKANTPTDHIDFTNNSAMSNYYWELFFHAPFLISKELNTDQRFKEAKKWYEYIFNPSIHNDKRDVQTAATSDDKFWRFLGLRSANNPTLEKELNASRHNSAKEWQRDLQNKAEQLASETDPFDPQEIASLRPISYQKAIVTHYIDNLLDWGDRLFRQNTRESIVDAEMWYVSAFDLLGKTPKALGAKPLPPAKNLSQLGIQKPFQSDYFGIPHNPQFLTHWDTVKQRLHNIRHGLNINGQKDNLPLFQPPIDPMKLVAAVASGEGLEEAVENLTHPTIPHYRFAVMIEKAKAVTQTVTQLGQSLLSALEKKDAEQLAALYNTNQQHIFNLTRTSKADQLKAAEANIRALQASLTSALHRQTHYAQLINASLSSSERKQIGLQKDAMLLQAGVEAIQVAAAVGYSLPVIFGFSDGGMKIGDAINQGANIAQGIGGLLSSGAALAGTVAAYQRRAEDWQLQEAIARDDVKQIQLQILAAKYQHRLAEQEITLLEEEIEQAQNVATFFVKKFTNSQLYQWYIRQVAGIYFQAYQLAYDIAKQAENAWEFEHIGRVDTRDSTEFIKPGTWSSLHHGLLAGETLQLDLQRMEKAFTDQNERRLEIEKTISLAQLDPKALLDLKYHDRCVFDIAEKDFDFDFPGHYCRQIKSVSISLPVVLGPYQNVHATLTQLTNKIVTSDHVGDDGHAAVDALLTQGGAKPDKAIKLDIRPNQQVALSQGVNDSGLFVLNFNDERYLPFEGTGAVSTWSLEMLHEDNAIDFDSLTDVIIRLQYIALAGSERFKTHVKKARGRFSGSRIYSLAQEFSAGWPGFSRQDNPQPLQLRITPSQWRRHVASFEVTGLSLYSVATGDAPAFSLMLTPVGQVQTTPVEANEVEFDFSGKNLAIGNIQQDSLFKHIDAKKPQVWTLQLKPPNSPLPKDIENLFLVVHYTDNP